MPKLRLKWVVLLSIFSCFLAGCIGPATAEKSTKQNESTETYTLSLEGAGE